jgi:hypothetical protein
MDPRNAFVRADDEVTSDFELAELEAAAQGLALVERSESSTQPHPIWRPLIDDDPGVSRDAEPLAEALLCSLLRTSGDAASGAAREGALCTPAEPAGASAEPPGTSGSQVEAVVDDDRGNRPGLR